MKLLDIGAYIGGLYVVLGYIFQTIGSTFRGMNKYINPYLILFRVHNHDM